MHYAPLCEHFRCEPDAKREREKKKKRGQNTFVLAGAWTRRRQHNVTSSPCLSNVLGYRGAPSLPLNDEGLDSEAWVSGSELSDCKHSHSPAWPRDDLPVPGPAGSVLVC